MNSTIKQWRRRLTDQRSSQQLFMVIIYCTLCVASSINCQIEEPHTDCNQRHRQQQQRQQRKYVPLHAAGQQQQAPAKLQRAPGVGEPTSEHEEFSLLTSAALAGSANNQLQQQQQQQSNQQLANTNHSTPPAATTDGTIIDAERRSNSPPTASSTTPTMPGIDSIGSSVVLQPPATTTSSIPSTSTSAAAASKSAPATTTTASSTSPNDGPNTTSATIPSTTTTTTTTTITPSVASMDLSSTIVRQQETASHSRQQASRRMEDSESTQRSLSLDLEPPFHHQYESHQQQQQQQSAPKPISSSPSSVSIITPLIGPPQQQQHHTAQLSASINSAQASESQQSMMRPIYVVGNPITERDYYSTSSSGTNRYLPTVNSNEPEPPSHQAAPASSETPPSASPVAVAEADPSKLPPMEAQATSQPTQTTSRQPQQQPQIKQLQLDSQPQQQPDSSSRKSTRLEAGHDEPTPPVSSQIDVTLQSQQDPPTGERMSGPPLVYSGGFLGSALGQPATPSGELNQTSSPAAAVTGQPQPQAQQSVAAPRLFQAAQPNPSASNFAGGAAVMPNGPRRPSLPPPVNQANAASGFRSPLSPSGPLLGNGATQSASQQQQQPSMLLPPISSLPANSMSNFYQSSPPYAGNSGSPALAGNSFHMIPQAASAAQPQPMLSYNKQAFALANQVSREQQAAQQVIQSQQQQLVPSPMPGTAPGSGRRPLNITRVEHISAECSNDLIRAVIVFNGTFKGIIYSSGYVNDPTCLYVNGTGSTRYEFNIRLNQCGTLGRQELHQPTIPGEARRRDQVMWNTLSIQYNSIIEQEWDEHFRVSCEYGSDFWKTVSFNPFNVETNTGSPVVFTINPPQCQMDVLLGHGMGPKIAVDGPVTVGDPLTLLIHMKSEKAGYDILVKNCVAHNGGKQRMQLIDSNGCVVNERFISPFRGTYNDNDLRHVTLYAYLKAFRFTGSPVLYLECEIHMCQSACPPQMCYWRRLSKRSVDDSDYEYVASNSSMTQSKDEPDQPVISDSLSLFKALQVRQEPDEERRSPGRSRQKRVRDIFAEDDQAALVCYRHAEVYLFLTTIGALLLLLLSVAVTCCLRLRKLAKSNLFKHGRLLGSPSLLSVGSGSGSDAASIISTATSSRHHHHPHSPAESTLCSHTQYNYSPNKRPTGWMSMGHGDIVRKQRVSPPNQPQQYLASFAQFSPKPARR